MLAVPSMAGAAQPAIKHVFVIVLENKDYDESSARRRSRRSWAGAAVAGRAADPVLRHGAQQPAQLHRDGLGPGAQPGHAGGLPDLPGFRPGRSAPTARRSGAGCVYPSSVKTVADQLDGRRADLGRLHGGHGQHDDEATDVPRTRRSTAPTRPRRRRPTDQYAARHNPFVYFHSIIDSPDCDERDVPLDRLPGRPAVRRHDARTSRSSRPTCAPTATTSRAPTGVPGATARSTRSWPSGSRGSRLARLPAGRRC